MNATPRATAAVLTAVALLASACATATETTAPTPAPTQSATAPPATSEPSPSAEPPVDASDLALVTSLGVDCGGLGDAPALGEPTITFVVDGQLHEVSRSGGRTTCLAEVADGPIRWGAQGDRVLVGSDLVVADAATPTVVPSGGTSVGFTRPTGTSTLAIREDGRVLAKTALDGGAVTDISFLADHDDAIYYPSGTHLLTIGTHADGRYGIWLSTNTGTEPKLLSEPGAGVVLSGLALDPMGVHLVFAADHGDESHIHRVRMLGESLAEGTDEAAADTLIASEAPLAGPVMSVDGWAVAAAAGSCADGGRELRIGHDDELDLSTLPVGDSVPVGWLSYGELVVAVATEGCVGTDPSELWIVTVGEPPTLVVRGATAAGLRSRDGDAPPPPIENFAGFA